MKKVQEISDDVLDLLGLKRKDLRVYAELLRLGSASVRQVAQEAGLNRGTAYDALKRLMDVGIVRFVDAKAHRYYTAEDPTALRRIVARREMEREKARAGLDKLIPSLYELVGEQSSRPAVKYYEGKEGVKDILRDVLQQTKDEPTKTYRVYSSAAVRDLIAAAWPRFNARRKQERVRVKAIAIGAGGKTVGLDERKWLTHKESAPSYIFIYAGRTAYVSRDDQRQLFGVIIDDVAVAKTQAMIFDSLWRHLN